MSVKQILDDDWLYRRKPRRLLKRLRRKLSQAWLLWLGLGASVPLLALLLWLGSGV